MTCLQKSLRDLNGLLKSLERPLTWYSSGTEAHCKVTRSLSKTQESSMTAHFLSTFSPSAFLLSPLFPRSFGLQRQFFPLFTAKLRIVTLLFIIHLRGLSFLFHRSLTRLTTIFSLPTKSQDVEFVHFPHESPPSCAHPSLPLFLCKIFLLFFS